MAAMSTLASPARAIMAACNAHVLGMYRSRMLLHYTGELPSRKAWAAPGPRLAQRGGHGN